MAQRMIFILFIFVFGQLIFCASGTEAGNFGFGVHSGYGVIKFKEKETYIGDNLESESRQNAILFGVSGEYSLQRPQNFYAGITTDWVFGLKDREAWRQDGVRIRANDIRIFGQFYDLRFGYKNRLENLYYRLYGSGGWDGLRFKREKWDPVTDTINEKISLWRIGLGTGLGYNIGKWAMDGRMAYSYYPEGETEDSSLPQYIFDTNGTCLDMGFGVAREIAKNMSFYLGGSYTLQKLKGKTTGHAISWRTTLEILVGMVNVTYAF